jgi:hypothetical protein
MGVQTTIESGGCRTTIAKSPGARLTPAETRPPQVLCWVSTKVTLPLPAEMLTLGK